MARPRRISTEEILTSAMTRLRRYGYHASSVQDLVDCTGAGRGSLYQTFGSKRGLFIAALRHYITIHQQRLNALLDLPSPSTEILSVFESLIEGSRDGCFLVNTSVELSPHAQEIAQTVSESFTKSRSSFFRLISQGRRRDPSRRRCRTAGRGTADGSQPYGGNTVPRPKIFSLKSALDQAIIVFRQHGYHNTSMHMISDRLACSRSTLHAAFGDKHGLFEQTLYHYGPAFRVPGLDALRGAVAQRDALLQVFDLAIDGAGNGHHQCLLINTAVELGGSSPTIAALLQTALCDLETRFRVAIERASTANEIAADVDPVLTARTLLGLYLGLCVLVRSGGAREPVLRDVVLRAQTMLPESR